MKKLILTLLVATAFISAAPAYAQYRGNNGYYNGHNVHRGGYNNNYHRGGYNNNWIAPAIGGLIIGGVVGAVLSQPYYAPAPVYAPPPVYVQPPPIYVQPGAGYAPPPPPYGYHHEQMLDNNCNCYVTILVPN